MGGIIIAIGSLITNIFRSIGIFLKETGLVIYKITKVFFKKIIEVIKHLSLIIWDKFLKYIFLFFSFLVKQLFNSIKYVLIKITNLTIIVSRFTWTYFLKYIYIFFIFMFVNTYLFLKYFLIYIYKTIKYIALFIWNNFIYYILLSIKKFSILIYENIIIAFKWLWKNVLRYLIWPFEKLLEGFRYILIKLFKLINIITTFIWDHLILKVLKSIYKLFTLVLKGLYYSLKYFFIFLRKLIINFKKVFIFIYRYSKYLIKSLPDLLYIFIKTIIIYIGLIIHFLLFLVTKYIIKYLYLLIKYIFIYIFKIFRYIFIKTVKLINYIFKIFSKLFSKLVDYLEYYYIILLLPIVLPLFLLMFIIISFKFIFVYFYIIIKTLLGNKVVIPNEVIYVRDVYNPSLNIFRNVINYNNNLKYNYTFSKGFKSIWLLIEIIVWQTIFIFIFTPLLGIVFLPFSLISLIFSKRVEITERIKVESFNTCGILRLNEVKINGKNISYKLDVETKYIDSIDQYIISDEKLTKVQIHLYVEDKKTKTYEFNFNYNLEYFIIKSFGEIKTELQNNKKHRFKLPFINHDKLSVKYKKVHKRDILNDDFMELRNRARNSSLRVLIYHQDKGIVFDQDILLKGIINTKYLEKLENDNDILNIKSDEYITKYLDKRYSYVFRENNNIDKDGKVICLDDNRFKCEYYIVDHQDKLYSINVQVVASRSILNNYLSQINNYEIDYKKQVIILKDIKKIDKTLKEVKYYIANERIPYNKKVSINKIINNKIKVINAVFTFNNEVIESKIRLDSIFNNKYFYFKNLLSLFDNNNILLNKDIIYYQFHKYVFKYKNKMFLELPFIGRNEILFLKWVSLNKNKIKSSGKIINDFYEEKFRVVCYYNIFIKKSYTVVIRINAINL